MQPDLHSALRAVIEQRLEVARAVCREPNGIVWRTERDRYDGSKYSLWEVMAPDLADPMGWLSVDPEVVAYLNLHHTADAIRRYERDLKMLERHWRNGGACEACWRVTSTFTEGVPWPCDDIKDLAQAYPEVLNAG